jgi:hypothetical protein
VQASTIASTKASATVTPGRTAAPSSAPATIVSGRPIPSSRSGTATSRRSSRTEIPDASANSTSVSVISASSFTCSPWMSRSTSPSTPTSSPAVVKNIAPETLRPSSPRETAA